MCGIAGYVALNGGLPGALLLQMRDALRHRGPDAAGAVRWHRDGRLASEGAAAEIGMAHRRLSIIDLSDAAAQPMSNEDGSLWITYNGEFYNFQDYRKELEAKGHVFRSDCDTETILHLYEEYGLEETLARMNGMFAFGLWDVRKQELVLARDRLGKKPLYYSHRPDGSLLFGSEIKSLLASGLIDRSKLDLTALDQFWTFGFSVSPRTAYEQIRQVGAAEYLVWREGKVKIHTYWDCPLGIDPLPEQKMEVLADELEALLCDAIKVRLVSDVPLGMFLSGGIDSSLLVALTVKSLEHPIDTYTISFAEDEFDESSYARQIAGHLGVSNTTLPVNEELQTYFSEISRQFDEPFGDSSAIPTYFVAKSARQHVTVALTGDGGDEVFAGYNMFRDGLRLWGTRRQRRQFKRPVNFREYLWDTKLRWLGSSRGFDLLQSQSAIKHRRQIYSPKMSSAISKLTSSRDRIKWYHPVASADWLSQMQYVSMKVNMVDDVLTKVDRMSMANSLECRSPLLDYRVVEYAARLPYSAKMNERGQSKAILRKILSRYVPDNMYERPKQGFNAPWEIWCQGPLGETLRTRWRQMNSDLFQAKAAGMLFPSVSKGSPFRQWQAFSLMEFMAAMQTETM